MAFPITQGSASAIVLNQVLYGEDEDAPAPKRVRLPPPAPPSTPLVEPPFLSERELAKGRTPVGEIMEKFPKHTSGIPSRKLYVKNLAKRASQADLDRVFGAFLPADHPGAVQLFTEGKMRGQAFIHFPDTKAALQAIRATHGFTLHGRPLIVAFSQER